MGLVDCTGSVRFNGEEMVGLQGLRDRAQGPGLRAGEPRHLPDAHRAPEPAARAEEAAGLDALGHGGHVPAVPAPQGARRHAGRRPLRRRAADADAVPHADGRPGTRHDRRAHRGPRAEDRRAGGAAVRGDQQARHLDPARRAEARHRARHLRAPVRDGPRQHRLRGHARATCARTPRCARNGWRSEPGDRPPSAGSSSGASACRARSSRRAPRAARRPSPRRAWAKATWWRSCSTTGRNGSS